MSTSSLFGSKEPMSFQQYGYPTKPSIMTKSDILKCSDYMLSAKLPTLQIETSKVSDENLPFSSPWPSPLQSTFLEF